MVTQQKKFRRFLRSAGMLRAVPRFLPLPGSLLRRRLPAGDAAGT